MKEIYFSSFVDEANITMNPYKLNSYESTFHRYSLMIPFSNREEGGHAVVILKKPSNAGKENSKGLKVSDDTIYRVTDYLYKLGNIQKVTIINLFTIVSGTTANIKEYIGTEDEMQHRNYNNEVIKQVLFDFNYNKDIVIAAWGSYSDILESKHKERIREVIKIVGKLPLYRVGPMVGGGKYAGHGKRWYDYEDITLYCTSGVR